MQWGLRDARFGDPTYDVENPGKRPIVPRAVQHQQRKYFDDTARAGPNVAVLNDPLPGRSALDQRGRRQQ